jgi:hypothetical protein
MSAVLFLGCRWFCIVFLVLYDMLILVLLNKRMIVLVSLPVYVNAVHFCFCVVLGVVFLFILVFVIMYVCVVGSW